MEINFKNKNILVTGGTGFVGSHLVEKLISLKANVTTTFLITEPYSYFSSKKFEKKVKTTNIDVCDFEKIFDLIVKNNIEYIFHLAAQPLVEVAYHNPKETLRTNILGTVNILESARLFPNVKAIIVASSDKAYGKLDKEKYIETDSLRGDHPYEVSKSAADLICYSYFKTYNLPVVATRFGNIYGEGDLNFSRIIPGIINAAIKKELLEIRSDGKHERDFLYVKDVVDGYILLAKKIDQIKGESFNFGSKNSFSILQLIKVIEKQIRKKIKIKILNNAKNEIIRQSLNCEKVKKLGWKQKYDLKKTIKKVYKWYEKNL